MARLLVVLALFLATAAAAEPVVVSEAALPSPPVDDGELVTMTLLEYLEENYPIVANVMDVAKNIAIVSLIFLPFQIFWPLVRRRPKVFTGEFWLDVFYWHQGILWTMVGAFGIAAWAVQRVWGDGVWFPQIAHAIPVWLQVVLAIWCYDFIVYWRHRLEHTLTPLWWFHATHHTAEHVDPLTTSRLHIGEMLLGGFLNAIVATIGFHPEAVNIAFPIYLYYNFFIHSNTNIRFPGFLKYVLVSPFLHQWHHAVDEEARGKNLGVIFAWNDWIFGTAYHPAHAPTKFGIDVPAEEAVGRTFFGHVLYPVKMLALTVRRLLVRPRRAA